MGWILTKEVGCVVGCKDFMRHRRDMWVVAGRASLGGILKGALEVGCSLGRGYKTGLGH